MAFFSRFRVGTLLASSFILIAALSLVVGLVAMVTMQGRNEAESVEY